MSQIRAMPAAKNRPLSRLEEHEFEETPTMSEKG